MTLKAAYGPLCLRGRYWRERVVGGEEPGAAVCVEHPFAEQSRIAQLRLEAPPVDSPVHQLFPAVLTCGSDHLQAGSQQGFLFPLHEVFNRHGWASLQVHGKAELQIK